MIVKLERFSKEVNKNKTASFERRHYIRTWSYEKQNKQPLDHLYLNVRLFLRFKNE